MISLSTPFCVFCCGVHDPITCTIYSTVNTRQKRLNALRFCYRCFMPGHLPTKCVEKVCCGICGKGSHHTALCCKNPRTKDIDIVSQTKEWCVFCNKHLNSTDCHFVKTFLTRFDRIKTLGLCTRCLKSHPNGYCSDAWVTCEYCLKTGHHKAVCRENPFLEENTKTDPTKGECMFCFRHKKPAECTVVTSLKDRLYILAQQGRCQKCLHKHPTEKCYYRYRCQICRSSEHSHVICPLDPKLDSNSGSAMPSLNPMMSATPLPSFNNTSNLFSPLTIKDPFSEYAGLSFASKDSVYLNTPPSSKPTCDDRWARAHVSAVLRGCGIEEDPKDLNCLESAFYDESPLFSHNLKNRSSTSYMSDYPTWYAPGFSAKNQTNYQSSNSGYHPSSEKSVELSESDQRLCALLLSDDFCNKY